MTPTRPTFIQSLSQHIFIGHLLCGRNAFMIIFTLPASTLQTFEQVTTTLQQEWGGLKFDRVCVCVCVCT